MALLPINLLRVIYVIKYIGSSIESKLQSLYVVISAHYCYVSNIYENVFGYVCYLNNKKIYEGNYANGNFLDLRYVKHARTRCYVRQYWKGSTISSSVSFQTFNEELGQKDTKFVLWTSSFFEYLLSQIIFHQDIFTSLILR